MCQGEWNAKVAGSTRIIMMTCLESLIIIYLNAERYNIFLVLWKPVWFTLAVKEEIVDLNLQKRIKASPYRSKN